VLLLCFDEFLLTFNFDQSLRLHTPSYKDHMPYLNFPSDWPTFVSKDRIADFIEHYASILKLNVSLDTEPKHTEFDVKSRQWMLETSSRDGKKRTFHPKHIVPATGLNGNQPFIPTFTDQDKFKGELYHAGKHNDASKVPNIKNKKIIIVGSSTFAHDIAQDFVTCGAQNVTMVQRGSNNVVSTNFLLQTVGAPLEEGLTIADADFQSKGTPNHVTLCMMLGFHAMMAAFDRKLLEGLAKTEYAVSNGENGRTWFYNALTRAGGFYIDVGASQMIIDGKIKVKQCPEGIKQFTDDGLVLADGRKVGADIVILATGWKMMGETIKSVIGDEVASRCGPVWGLDEEGEMRSVSMPLFDRTLNHSLGCTLGLAPQWTSRILAYGGKSRMVSIEVHGSCFADQSC
jgi:cation diffusion facilitator CzcD-associated flavoprotein CzcO